MNVKSILKRKKVILTLLILLFIYISMPRSLNKVARLQYDKVNEIVVTNGDTGHRTIIKDKEKINNFIDYTDKCYISYDWIQISAKGYEYRIVFLNNEEVIADIIFDNRMNVNNKYYRLVKPKYDAMELKKLIEQ